MTLIFQEFRARAGQEDRLLAALRHRASAAIRDARADAVLVCQHADLPQRVLWIQHHLATAPAPDPEGSRPAVEPDPAEWAGARAQVEFVDGGYRFPLPPCRVWEAEAAEAEAAGALLRLARLAVADPRLAGVSVYRAAGPPPRVIAFFALPPDATLRGYWREVAGDGLDERVAVHPLRVSWTVGRLAPGAPRVASLVRYPRAAFWARLGPALSPAGPAAWEPATDPRAVRRR